jgi:ABC1 atypical kinase-like domain
MKIHLYTLSRLFVLFLGIFIQKRVSLPFLKRWSENRIQSQGGVGVKLRQFSAMKNADPMASPLWGTAKPIDHSSIRAHLFSLDKSLSAQLVHVDETGLQGSVAQVHRARLKGGDWVALKICRPRIRESIQADSRGLNHGLKAFQHFRKGFDSNSYAAFFSSELGDELNLKREAEIQSTLRNVLKGCANLCIPSVHEDLSSESILVMDWESSTPMAAAKILSGSAQDHLLHTLSSAILTSIWQGNLLLADLNPGNLGWRMSQGPVDEPTLVCYDFGSVLHMSTHQAHGFADLIAALRNLGDTRPALERLGFSWTSLEPLQALLPEYLRLLFEPLLSEKPYDLSQWNRKQRAEALLGERRWTFMSAAPPELFAFMRCLHGWFHWHQVLTRPFHAFPILDRLLATKSEPRPLGSDAPTGTMQASMGSTSTVSTRLHIHVTVGGETRVKLTLPAACAGDLQSLVDPDLLPQIEATGVNLNNLSQYAVNSGFAAMDLFRQQTDQRVVHIFLA